MDFLHTKTYWKPLLSWETLERSGLNVAAYALCNLTTSLAKKKKGVIEVQCHSFKEIYPLPTHPAPFLIFHKFMIPFEQGT